MLLTLYIALGVLLFLEDHIFSILVMARQDRLYKSLFVFVDILYLFFLYPLEILANNYGGRKSLRLVISLISIPFLFFCLVIMVIEIYIRVIVEMVTS